VEGEKVDFAIVIATLLHDLEVMLKDYKARFDAHFGPGSILVATIDLQKLANNEILKVILDFKKFWDVKKILVECSQALQQLKSSYAERVVARYHSLSLFWLLLDLILPLQEETEKIMKDLPMMLRQISSISQALQSHKIFLDAIVKVR